MTIKTKYKFGDILYLRCDPEQREYVLVGIIGRPGSLYYELSFLGEIVEVCDFEVEDCKDILKTLDVNKKEE